MRAPSGIPSLLEQAVGCSASYAAEKSSRRKPLWPANPFPSGVQPGSVTNRVLQAAEDHYPRWLEHNELMLLTGGSRGAIAWAVRYLQEKKRLRSIPSMRRTGYRRYQFVKDVEA